MARDTNDLEKMLNSSVILQIIKQEELLRAIIKLKYLQKGTACTTFSSAAVQPELHNATTRNKTPLLLAPQVLNGKFQHMSYILK